MKLILPLKWKDKLIAMLIPMDILTWTLDSKDAPCAKLLSYLKVGFFLYKMKKPPNKARSNIEQNKFKFKNPHWHLSICRTNLHVASQKKWMKNRILNI